MYPNLRIIIITDSHITEGRIFNKAMFDRAVDKINSLKADYVIHLGDITHEGTLADYEYAVEVLKPLEKHEFYKIPGNHDSKNVGDLLYREFFGKRTFEIEDKNTYLVGLDSSVPDENGGRIGRRAINWLDKKLSQLHDSYFKIVCFHHHQMPIPYTGRERSTIDDSGDMLKVLLNNDVHLVLNGHRHISNIYRVTDGIGQMVVVNVGTVSCNKTRYRDLQTFAIIDIDETDVTVKNYQLRSGEEKVNSRTWREPHREFDPKVERLSRIIHISDSHFTHALEFQEDVYNKAVSVINDMEADLVVHTGDVTYNAFYSEFMLALKNLKQIEHPLLVVPGPRDCFANGWDIFPETIGKEINQSFSMESTWENPDLEVIGVNTCLLEDEVGLFGRRRLHDILDIITQRKKEKIIALAFHHHLIPCPRTRHTAGLQDNGDVLDALAKSGVDLILTGHKHIGFAVQVEDAIIVNCGTIASQKVLTLKMNTFNIIDVYKNGYVKIDEYSIQRDKKETIGSFFITILE